MQIRPTATPSWTTRTTRPSRKFSKLKSRTRFFTHWPIDNHPDHRAIANLTYEAWKQLKRSFALYYYEVSDGDDTAQFPAPTHYVDITAVAETKKAGCYAHASQSPDYFYGVQDTVASFRGLQNGTKKAEAFILQVGGPFDVFPRAGLTS